MARVSSTCGARVLRGSGVSFFRADFDFPLFVVLSDVFFVPNFFIAVLGFGGKKKKKKKKRWRFLWFRSGRVACLGFFGSIAPFFFIDLRAKETRDQCAKCERSWSQMRKRTTATERNRARDTINAYSSDLLKKLQNS